MLFGMMRLEPDHRLHASVQRFLDSVRVGAWDRQAAEVHAGLRHQLRSHGRTIGEMDMLIAAHAISLGAILVTNNTRHFSRLEPELAIENWTDETD